MTEEILADSAGRADPALLWRPLTFAACKLLPTHLARQSAFNTALTSGEDVAYFAPFMARHDLMLDTTPAHHGATYYPAAAVWLDVTPGAELRLLGDGPDRGDEASGHRCPGRPVAICAGDAIDD